MENDLTTGDVRGLTPMLDECYDDFRSHDMAWLQVPALYRLEQGPFCAAMQE